MARKQSEEPPRRRAPDPERGTRLLIIGGVAAALLVVAGLIGFGWYQTQIAPRGKTVLSVGETKFSLAHVESRMSLLLEENPFFLQSQDILQSLPVIVLNQLEQEGKLLEAAVELDGLTVSDEELDARIREGGGLAEDVSPSDFVAELDRQIEESGLNESEYLQMLRAQLLEAKASTYFTEVRAPEREPQVRARWIVLQEEEQADEALERLDAGEDFATVATDLSVDTTTAEQGGELDWQPRGPRGGIVPEEVLDFLFEADPGQRSDVISTSSGSGIYIVELLERDDDRELDEAQRPLVGARLMENWLDELNETLNIKQDLSQEDAIRALNDILS